MESNKKLRRSENRDKRERFSIRKFNVGVASVVVAAFWMVGGSQIAAADTVDAVTPETTVEVVEAPAEEEAVTLAENTGLPAYIEQAQAAIDEVKAETKKKELSDRLNALTAALDGQAVDTSLEAPAEEETPVVEEPTPAQEPVAEVATAPAYEEPVVYYQPEQTTTYVPQAPVEQPVVPVAPVVQETPATTTEEVVETQ